MICLIFVISEVFKIATQASNMLSIRSKMECWASGDKSNLVRINDTLIKMDQKSRNLFLSRNHYQQFCYFFTTSEYDTEKHYQKVCSLNQSDLIYAKLGMSKPVKLLFEFQVIPAEQ